MHVEAILTDPGVVHGYCTDGCRFLHRKLVPKEWIRTIDARDFSPAALPRQGANPNSELLGQGRSLYPNRRKTPVRAEKWRRSRRHPTINAWSDHSSRVSRNGWLRSQAFLMTMVTLGVGMGSYWAVNWAIDRYFASWIALLAWN